MLHLLRDDKASVAAALSTDMPTPRNSLWDAQPVPVPVATGCETPPRPSSDEKRTWTPPPAPRRCRVRPRHESSLQREDNCRYAKVSRVLDFGTCQDNSPRRDNTRDVTEGLRGSVFAKAARKLNFDELPGMEPYLSGLQIRCAPRQPTSSQSEIILQTIREMTAARKLR